MLRWAIGGAMSIEAMSVLASGMSAVAALAALAVGWLSLVQSRQASAAVNRQSAHAMDSTLQARLDPLYPGLRAVLGQLDDGVPPEIRAVLVPFFVLYSDAFAAHRDGLLDDRDWLNGTEFAYWAQKPVARRAWSAFREQTWTAGFREHVDGTLQGPPAYPNLTQHTSTSPEFEWPEDSARTNPEPGSADVITEGPCHA